MPEKQTTAGELVARLSQDPDWAARQRDAAQRQIDLETEFHRLEKPVLDALAEVGFQVPSLGDSNVIAHMLPLTTEVVEVVLRWLRAAHWRVQESLVRLLAAAAEPFDGQILAEVFDHTLKQDSDSLPIEQGIALKELRWAIANTIACAKPFGISQWLVTTLRNPLVGSSKEMLLLATPSLLPNDIARGLVISLFDEFPTHCAKAMSETGGQRELGFLESKAPVASGLARKEIDRAIRSIRKRLKGKAGRC